MSTPPRPRRVTFLPLLILVIGCGESWTWDVGADGKDTAPDAAIHDVDRDGFTDLNAGGDDCDDNDATVNPGAVELWYDGVDQNCAGDDDFDQDADAHRSATHADLTGALGDDCYDALDDAYPSGAASCPREADLPPSDVYPGATDTAYDGTDADCSGNDDFDQDGDGFGRCTECDDTDAAIYPNDEPDVWYDGVDANCDGNDGDQDGDGYSVAGYAYTIPADYNAGDCDDLVAGTYPGAAETWYDGVDSDCGRDDDFDQDGDGYQAVAWGGEDCDDVVGSTYPGAADAWYDGVDSDCLGNDDFDQDGDGYSTDDCDDLDAGVNLAAAEDCATAYDDNCDGDTNDVGATGCASWWEDADGDGYGGAEACLCVVTATYSIGVGEDCDDGDDTVSPAATEVCNDGVDNDCDGGAGACALTGGSLSGADAEYTGEATGDCAGYSVAGAGDVNGDGFDDLVVGAFGNFDGGNYAGAAYIVLGSATPASASLALAVQFTGEAEGDYAGFSVAAAGDVDGDGLDDVAVGASSNSDGGTRAGAAYLLLGSSVSASGSLGAAIEFTGEAAQDYAGYSVCTAGDVNGDGWADLLVGAPRPTGGTAYLVLGSAAPTGGSLAGTVSYTGEAAGDQSYVVGSAGDVNGDGLADILVGAPSNGDGGPVAGAAYLVLGSSSPLGGSLAADIEYTGETSGDSAGSSVAGAGDVDGDGYADSLVGATYNAAGGAAAGAGYLVLGSASPSALSLATAVRFTGEATQDFAGRSVAGAGDVDGDGHDDFLIGAFGNAGYRGGSYLILGSVVPASTSLSAATKYSGSADVDYAGIVAGAGDVNADGYADIVIGAYGNGDFNSGAAYLILGQGL